MKRIGYCLGAFWLGWLLELPGAEITPFGRQALFTILTTVVGIIGLIMSVVIVYRSENRERTYYDKMIDSRRRSLRRNCRGFLAIRRW